jgi:hypothetical protein
VKGAGGGVVRNEVAVIKAYRGVRSIAPSLTFLSADHEIINF